MEMHHHVFLWCYLGAITCLEGWKITRYLGAIVLYFVLLGCMNVLRIATCWETKCFEYEATVS